MTITRSQARPGPSGGYRDQILHANPSPDGQAFLGDLRGFSRVADSQDVQDVQAPGDQAVTAGPPYRQDDCADGRHRYARSRRDGAMRCVCGKVADVTARPAAPPEPPPADPGPFTWDCGPADWRAAWEAWARR